MSVVRDVIYSYPLFGFVYEGQPAGPALGYGAHQPFYRADVVGGLFVRKNMIWPLLLMEFVTKVPRLNRVFELSMFFYVTNSAILLDTKLCQIMVLKLYFCNGNLMYCLQFVSSINLSSSYD